MKYIFQFPISVAEAAARHLFVVLVGVALMPFGCRTASSPTTSPDSRPAASSVRVMVNPGGPIVLKTSKAEFEILPSGYLRAYLLKDGRRLTLDDPIAATPVSGDFLLSSGRELSDFVLDFEHAKVSQARGKIGSRGKRVEIGARYSSRQGVELEKTLTVEVYDEFPNLAISSVAYKNSGTKEVKIDRIVARRQRLNASLVDPQRPPYKLWSFHGSSYEWGKDDVKEVSQNFSQPNLMGQQTPRGLGGGIPVVAFWSATVGEAIGHIETLPLVLSLPARVDPQGRIDASLVLDTNTDLKPGEVLSTPRSIVAIFSGDFYEPLRLWSSVLQHEGWTLPRPSSESYNISWCGWGYEFNVTPAQMLGTMPKLKEFNIHWATLDDRWFDTYGDWEPRADTFPGDSIRKMVDEFHKQGIRVQIWWLPLGVEDGLGKYESHRYKITKVVKAHPEWLILDKKGHHARMVRDLAALCPAVPEVQAYYKQLVERFIRDLGFDGHKLDNVYTVPACYNAIHHHKTPEDSIYAMGEVYKVIFETTRALKPDSVTQSCPCGTPPSLAWLPYMDQAVSADPVGSAQVRRRVKMYKALLGPEAAVYGDHVELTEIKFANVNNELDLGRDFASTVGTGGVVGTKFVWPDPGPHFKTVLLTPEKEAEWKKWIDLYHSKMLSRGTFLNLYITGYDIPEGYAIAKEGKMYYAFFSPDSSSWKGEVELRGLPSGKYRVYDYENGRDLGTIDARAPRLAVEMFHHLLLEVSKLS